MQIRAATHAGIGDGVLVRLAHHLLETGIVTGVGVEGAVIRARLLAVATGLLRSKHLLVFQHADDLDHRLRVVSGFGEILCAQPIRFQFVLAAIASGPGLRQRLQQRCASLVAQARYQNRPQHRPQTRRGSRTLLPHAMTRGHMADFVAHYAGQFSL